VKMLQGSTMDSALVAWSKFERALGAIGRYQSVIFDDAIIHRVVIEMGGWMSFGDKDMKEWPFVRNEFVNRYRGYKMRSECPDYPAVLIGITDANNGKHGFELEPPTMIGNADLARKVQAGGTDKPLFHAAQIKIGSDSFQIGHKSP
jgi:hypothetical protein